MDESGKDLEISFPIKSLKLTFSRDEEGKDLLVKNLFFFFFNVPWVYLLFVQTQIF